MSDNYLLYEKNAIFAYEQAKSETHLFFSKFGCQKDSAKFNDLPDIYLNSEIYRKIKRRKYSYKEPVILFTDIDNTFFDSKKPEVTNKLAHILETLSMGLVYVTNRDEMVLDPTNNNLPLPDIAVYSGGTEIFVKQKNGQYSADESFRQILKENLYDESKILQSLEHVKSEFIGQIEVEMKLFYREFIFGFEIVCDRIQRENVKQLIRIILNKYLLQNCKIIIWDGVLEQNIYAVVMPVEAGKKEAVVYLSKLLSVKNSITAGDSEIDIDMIFNSGHTGVLVRSTDLKAKSMVNKFCFNVFDGLYSTSDNKLIYYSKEYTSDGLLEALKSGWINPLAAKEIVLNCLLSNCDGTNE